MAAYIVCPSEEDWPVIERFLLNCGEGAVVIPPEARALIEDGTHGIMPGDVGALDGDLAEYDFGGEADILIDCVRSPDHFFVSTELRGILGLEEEDGSNDAEIDP